MAPQHPPAIPLDHAAAEARFVGAFGVPLDATGRVLPIAAGAPCRFCCHWTLPLSIAPRQLAHGVALTFVEWLIWDWHVRHHQGGVPLA